MRLIHTHSCCRRCEPDVADSKAVTQEQMQASYYIRFKLGSKVNICEYCQNQKDRDLQRSSSTQYLFQGGIVGLDIHCLYETQSLHGQHNKIIC